MSTFGSSNDFAVRSASNAAASIPSACPACHSSKITTTAKSPDANSYWRCDSCGEIWNVSRRHAVNSGAHTWR